jgi:hypothetical protein
MSRPDRNYTLLHEGLDVGLSFWRDGMGENPEPVFLLVRISKFQGLVAEDDE